MKQWFVFAYMVELDLNVLVYEYTRTYSVLLCTSTYNILQSPIKYRAELNKCASIYSTSVFAKFVNIFNLHEPAALVLCIYKH